MAAPAQPVILHVFCRVLLQGGMYQIAYDQLIETSNLLTVFQSFWDGMVPLFVGIIGRIFRL